jgi:hypothetical protein
VKHQRPIQSLDLHPSISTLIRRERGSMLTMRPQRATNRQRRGKVTF